MSRLVTQFAAAESSEGGISALGLNLKAFIFQLITFVLVFLILRRYVFPKLVETMEKRREVLEQSLVDARKTQEALSKAEQDVAKLLSDARTQADQALADAQAQGKELVKKAESAAEERAARLLDEAKSQIENARGKLREELKTELTDLVVITTEKVLRAKLDDKQDARLIEQSLKDVR